VAGLVVLGALCSAALLIFLAPGQVAPAVHAQTSSNAVEDGRLLYIQNCASCHGNTGEGSTIAPPLASAGPAGLDFYMRTGRMPLGRPGTPGYEQPPQLSEAQVAAIIQYASAFSQGPQIPSVTTGADLSRGWELYVNNCAACHGAAADGGSVGAGIMAPTLHGRDATTVAEAMLIGPGVMPRFSFPQADVDAITSYVDSLNTPTVPGGFPLPGGGGPVVEGAIAAVLGVFVLLAITRWVARRDSLPPDPPRA
jgi:ubiquinol-cytochrome c reductase cytochrome c subunit